MSALHLDLLGRTLTVPEASEALVAWLEEQWHFPEHAGALTSDWTFVLERLDGAEPEDLRAGARPLEGSFNPLDVAWDASGAVWLLEQAGGVRVALEGQRTVRLGWYGTLAHSDALYQGLCEAMRASGLIPLHASVAARAEGGLGMRASAFLGPSGTGKTTTLLRLIAAGWTPVAEDFSWIEPETLTLYSWDRALHLLPDTLERLHALFPGLEPEPFNGRKHPVSFERLGGRLWTVPLERLIVLERAETVSRAALRAGQMAPHLYIASGLPLLAPLRQPFALQVGEMLGRLDGQVWRLDRHSPLDAVLA